MPDALSLAAPAPLSMGALVSVVVLDLEPLPDSRMASSRLMVSKSLTTLVTPPTSAAALAAYSPSACVTLPIR
ncbi:hypothetical protein D3C79_1096490 [compost metagenome]